MTTNNGESSEQHLRLREGDLLTIIDAIPIDITVLAADGAVLHVNQFALNRFGLSAHFAKEGYLERTCHPDDLDQVLEERRRNLSKGVPFKLEMRLLSKSGEPRWHLRQYNPLRDEQGQIIRWYVTAIDIDDRKRAEQILRQSEQDLRTITDAIRQVIVVLAPDGKTLYANQVACEETGLSLNAIMKEGFAPQAFHPDEVDWLRAREEGLRRGDPFELELRARQKSGEYRWKLVQYNPLKDESGQIIRWYATATDIEDRKRTEELRLEEQVNERTRIARELHDTLLQSFHGLLLKLSAVKYLVGDRPKEAEEQLDRLVEQAEQAITEGRDAVLGLRSSTLLANDLAQAITNFGAGLAGDGGSPQFRVRAEGRSRDLSPSVRDEVYRIASEALRNAFRHADAGRIEVEIYYDNRELRLRVRDDGKGIDAKTFNSGMRAGHHGMPGMHERAKLAGGKLTLWSQPDSGTEIELTIPAPLAYVKDSPSIG